MNWSEASADALYTCTESHSETNSHINTHLVEKGNLDKYMYFQVSINQLHIKKLIKFLQHNMMNVWDIDTH